MESSLTGGTLPQGPDLLDLITEIKATTTTTPTNPLSKIVDEKQDESKRMYRSELDTILQMCDKDSMGYMMDLPSWIQECVTKGTSKNYMSIIIQKFVTSNTFYDNTNVPLTSPLLKMTIKRAWTGKYGNINRPSLLHAMEVLSPFTMLYLSKDEVTLLNNEDDLITLAYLISVAAIR